MLRHTLSCTHAHRSATKFWFSLSRCIGCLSMLRRVHCVMNTDLQVDMASLEVATHMWCSMLQCVTVCCSVLQCVAMCCSVLQCVEKSWLCNQDWEGHGLSRSGNEWVLQWLSWSGSAYVLKCVVVFYSVLQCVAVCYSVFSWRGNAYNDLHPFLLSSNFGQINFENHLEDQWPQKLKINHKNTFCSRIESIKKQIKDLKKSHFNQKHAQGIFLDHVAY